METKHIVLGAVAFLAVYYLVSHRTKTGQNY